MILKPVHLTSWGGSHTFAIWALEFAVGQSFHPLGRTVELNGNEWKCHLTQTQKTHAAQAQPTDYMGSQRRKSQAA